MLGHFLRPSRKHCLRRHAIKRVVDLDRRETLAVIAQHRVCRQLLGIEVSDPFLVRVAAGTGEQHSMTSFAFDAAVSRSLLELNSRLERAIMRERTADRLRLRYNTVP